MTFLQLISHGSIQIAKLIIAKNLEYHNNKKILPGKFAQKLSCSYV